MIPIVWLVYIIEHRWEDGPKHHFLGAFYIVGEVIHTVQEKYGPLTWIESDETGAIYAYWGKRKRHSIFLHPIPLNDEALIDWPILLD